MGKKLSATAFELFPEKHSGTKEQSYWEIDDGYFPREDMRFDLIEIGVLTLRMRRPDERKPIIPADVLRGCAHCGGCC